MTELSQLLDYRLFDADNHYYEPIDMFVEYIEPVYSDRTLTLAERDGETIALFESRSVGFDALWARVNEARVLVCLHLGNSGYMEHYSADWGENPDPEGVRSNPGAGSGVRMPDHNSLGRSAFQWTMLYRDRPIMDTLAILIYHNLFGRFPDIRVASVENGSIWVPYLLRPMDNMKGMGRNGPWPNGYVKGRPSAVFRNHVFVSPHHYGEDIGALVDLLGVEHVLFGSDFPHAEGMSGVDDYQERAGEFAAGLGHPPDTTRDVMRDNGMRLLGLSQS